ncbi:N-acetyl sugar amidotransferase [Puniceicoccus vermicola]|uniref:N-acetyl sugar amidotransferase n=1 Tax=Puniceicoccus vermicola TaxID=388746 RepID=A0A7X1E3K4_9BACT|nr:N-acetyl sugar amidotransferase [Puniceicoccus vermicola]MBC2601068.1 N-acetyl sugar amidotransferase [Puniceicoccus vermicola]
MIKKPNIHYCKRCLYPAVSVNLSFNREGVCSACLLQEEMNSLTPAFWEQREAKWKELVTQAKATSESNYDCVVPVSGGKDSYFQVDKAIEYGLKPLLVTYHGNNYLPEGQRNLDRMRSKFGADHIVMGPSIEVLKKLNESCFRLMGDMNWHCHAGIKIFPMQVAVRFKIPLVLWGEITWSVAGMFDMNDYVQYNKRTVYEHDLRGYTIKDIVEKTPGVNEKDLAWLRMPSDHEFADSKTIGLYVGNFFDWNPNKHTEEMIEKYDFELSEQPFERTYRRMSNLDDMHENGIHDYMKFIKFGYGRATDHSSKDVRSGYFDREKALEMVEKYDHVKPRKDLNRWLEYVGMSEEEFDHIADTFRSPKVWWIKDNQWHKQTPRGDVKSYGQVNLSESETEIYFKE